MAQPSSESQRIERIVRAPVQEVDYANQTVIDTNLLKKIGALNEIASRRANYLTQIGASPYTFPGASIVLLDRRGVRDPTFLELEKDKRQIVVHRTILTEYNPRDFAVDLENTQIGANGIGAQRWKVYADKTMNGLTIFVAPGALEEETGFESVGLEALKSFDSREQYKEFLIYTDNLMGIGNRRKAEKSLNDLLELPVKTRYCATVVDANEFKRLNDEKGHQRGDDGLEAIAQALVEVFDIPEHGKPYRLGGDEILLITGDLSPEEISEMFENDVARVLQKKSEALGLAPEYVLSVCAGITQIKNYHVSPSSVIREADLAMLTAKSARKPAQVFSPEVRQFQAQVLGINSGKSSQLSRLYHGFERLRARNPKQAEELRKAINGELGQEGMAEMIERSVSYRTEANQKALVKLHQLIDFSTTHHSHLRDREILEPIYDSLYSEGLLSVSAPGLEVSARRKEDHLKLHENIDLLLTGRNTKEIANAALLEKFKITYFMEVSELGTSANVRRTVVVSNPADRLEGPINSVEEISNIIFNSEVIKTQQGHLEIKDADGCNVARLEFDKGEIDIGSIYARLRNSPRERLTTSMRLRRGAVVDYVEGNATIKSERLADITGVFQAVDDKYRSGFENEGKHDGNMDFSIAYEGDNVVVSVPLIAYYLTEFAFSDDVLLPKVQQHFRDQQYTGKDTSDWTRFTPDIAARLAELRFNVSRIDDENPYVFTGTEEQVVDLVTSLYAHQGISFEQNGCGFGSIRVEDPSDNRITLENAIRHLSDRLANLRKTVTGTPRYAVIPGMLKRVSNYSILISRKDLAFELSRSADEDIEYNS